MHSALRNLLKLRGRALMRRIGRGLKKPAGILFAILAVIIGVAWLIPVIVGSIAGEPVDPEPIRRYGPVALLGMLLGNMFNRNAQHTVHFSPAEIDMLFPAPFSRRELLTYKVTIILVSSLGLGLLFSIFLLQFSGRWFFGFVSMTLAMLLVNLLSMAVVLSGQYLGELLRSFPRKLAAGALAVLSLMWVAATLPIDRDRGVIENIHAVLESPIISIALAPFAVFVEMLTAESWLVFIGMAAIALLMCIGVFMLNLLLDERGIEATIERGARYHQHIERAKKHAGVAFTYTQRSARWRISELPWLGGAGPILHRQLTTALRGIRSILGPMAIQLGVFGALVILIGRDSESAAIGAGVFGVIMIGIALPQMLTFDFRGDLDQMDWLKMLPIPAVPMVIGEVLTPLAIVTALQWILLAFTAIALPEVPFGSLMVIAVMAVPLNALNIMIDNGLFLAYPTRTVTAGTADLTGLGRNMMLFIGKGILLIGCLGISALFGWLTWWITNGSWIMFFLVVWTLLAAAGMMALLVLAKLFQQFDVSRDMPA